MRTFAFSLMNNEHDETFEGQNKRKKKKENKVWF
jgi:hypothetical protein